MQLKTDMGHRSVDISPMSLSSNSYACLNNDSIGSVPNDAAAKKRRQRRGTAQRSPLGVSPSTSSGSTDLPKAFANGTNDGARPSHTSPARTALAPAQGQDDISLSRTIAHIRLERNNSGPQPGIEGPSPGPPLRTVSDAGSLIAGAAAHAVRQQEHDADSQRQLRSHSENVAEHAMPATTSQPGLKPAEGASTPLCAEQ